jgi:hypothetical protein
MGRRLGVLAVVAVAATAATACADDGEGALAQSQVLGTVGIGVHALEVGDAVQVGGPILVNDSDDDVVIDSVELVELAPGVALEGWALRDLRGRAPTGTSEAPFPPADARDPVDRTIAPTQARNDEGNLLGEVEIVLGLRLEEPGVHHSVTVRVTYVDSAGRRTIDVNRGYTLCGPAAEFLDGACPLPPLGGD